jgi:hypothetical protein
MEISEAFFWPFVLFQKSLCYIYTYEYRYCVCVCVCVFSPSFSKRLSFTETLNSFLVEKVPNNFSPVTNYNPSLKN